MALILKGKLDAKRIGSYDGRDYAVLQFVERDERNAIKLVEINLPDGADHTQFVEGKTYEILVSVSGSKTGKIYYRAILGNMAAAA